MKQSMAFKLGDVMISATTDLHRKKLDRVSGVALSYCRLAHSYKD
jgi:hypothetical protein